ncbi:Crp/Fnr family transcriptional regulator [Anabaena cylindrica FACHB-243]|nr:MULTISPECIES: Crp/Fnr family transcriptional regulator [Anabaena]MBD2418567.1 Crp/Fnr family transcriptional regulator [Anabaena cylindrica FACHB-243]MBY5283579.1 Crp/Fnr family transcriptional regulator [Anabaena sp. CCAP 1446/1C]MBY5309938.1 Crp/Fnr family transcriptional regulator [Anabaena sp. CCAP 1446/1C]MCM2409313.1 Crp/Fnr family transcriptional regulator [Anabaena sp. CCAP 1446/1C]
MSLYTGLTQSSTNNTQKHFNRRSLLPIQKNALWQIESGFVMTYTYLENGTTVALGLWGPGDVVGELLSTMKPYQIECLTKVEATALPVVDWHQLTPILLYHIQQAEELMVIRSHKKVEAMLIQLLAWLSKKFGSEVEKGRLIDMRLTHEDLAALISSTRVTITRILGQLEQEGLIDRLSLHRIIVLQEDIWYYEI